MGDSFGGLPLSIFEPMYPIIAWFLLENEVSNCIVRQILPKTASVCPIMRLAASGNIGNDILMLSKIWRPIYSIVKELVLAYRV